MNKGRGIFRDQRVLLCVVIVILAVAVGIINPRFVRLNNIVAILQQISVLGVLTMAMSMLLISGGIDLSIGNMMTLSSVVVATLLMRGANLFVAVLAGFGVAILGGLLNGFIIAKSRTMPLIITLGTGQMFNGISLLIAGGSFLQFQNKLDFLRTIKLFDFLPLMVIFMLAIVLLSEQHELSLPFYLGGAIILGAVLAYPLVARPRHITHPEALAVGEARDVTD